ncbi:MAG: hypothetical protein ACIAQZ_11680, partial [Sedimentisphaeraceae bacterium JB056]
MISGDRRVFLCIGYQYHYVFLVQYRIKEVNPGLEFATHLQQLCSFELLLSFDCATVEIISLLISVVNHLLVDTYET